MLATALAAVGPARATVLPWMSLEEMALRADVIALGTVEAVEGAMSDDGRIIVTRVTLQVEKTLKGGPRARVTLEVPGGRIGDRILIASGAPTFAKGDRAVLFLEGAPGGGRLSVVGWNLGRFEVRRDPQSGRDLVNDRTGGALYLDKDGRPVDPGRRGVGRVELGDFLRQVEAILDKTAHGKGVSR